MALTKFQKQLAREHGGNNVIMPDCFTWVEGSLTEVKRLIGWLEYVAENEYTEDEKQQLIAVAIKFAEVAQPIASKYLD